MESVALSSMPCDIVCTGPWTFGDGNKMISPKKGEKDYSSISLDKTKTSAFLPQTKNNHTLSVKDPL